ncbi:aminoglycoside phosphotransferase (APT) family kinase protein [Chitinophaga niastensis]|uniref:Aminoglycoside phosphotransferase (APT) family kinase protein n=1 Tax=Chitinophaga niastensis TaxID=536980 RepID=A0A2P8HHL5_CHINA|nr:aminoglycoside phosphotransferase family protein [Chitinophaga niastensis]PSL45670.1 aminoglycoside phosphotransferase (APT) family kinase protein [Chitinophaga niastensis]
MQPGKKINSSGTPDAEIRINEALVYALLKEQHPDLIHLPLHFEQAGWDNVIFRLGEQMLVRLPRRKAATMLIEHEQTWLPLLMEGLPLAIPAPYRIGKPNSAYPWRWSILPWLPGVPADEEAPDADQAKIFAAFLKALHKHPPSDAPLNPARSVPLHQRALVVEERIQRLKVKTDLITKKIEDTWSIGLSAPLDVQKKWIHGDLHAQNVLVENGQITGIIDWGDITAGDIATDLAAIWMIFPNQDARRAAISAYINVSEATWQRAKGWAILFAALLLDTGLINNPRHAAMGEKIFHRIAEDE